MTTPTWIQIVDTMKYDTHPKMPVLPRAAVLSPKKTIFAKKAFELKPEEDHSGLSAAAKRITNWANGNSPPHDPEDVEVKPGSNLVYVKNEQYVENGNVFVQLHLVFGDQLVIYPLVKKSSREWNFYTLLQKKNLISEQINMNFTTLVEGNVDDRQ
jgi:hypothetical protein